MTEISQESKDKVNRLVDKFTVKTGTATHPNTEVTDAVKLGLGKNMDELKKPEGRKN